MLTNQKSFKSVTFLFFLSGFTALCYQIIWTRLLLYTFGNTTYSVVAVLAAFMAGLGIGSFLFGKFAHRFTHPLKVFGLIELGIGIFALATPSLFQIINSVYLWALSADIATSSSQLVLVKFIGTSLCILPATILMGGTFPTLLTSCLKLTTSHPKLTGQLYGVNTFGSIVGALSTGFIAIEIFGLTNSIYLATIINFTVFILTRSIRTAKQNIPFVKNSHDKHIPSQLNFQTTLVILLYGISGITSMALEVLWIRLLTPLVGTYIYAFSLILVTFLLGLTLGSFIYERYLISFTRIFTFLGIALLTIASSAFFSVLITASGILPHNALLQTLGVVLPGTIAMGTILPAVTALARKEELGSFIGKALLANSLGSTLGPILAGFFLIPIFGSTRSVLIIAVIVSLLAATLFTVAQSKRNGTKKLFISASLLFALALAIVMITGKDKILTQRFLKHQKALHIQDNQQIFEDEVATVFAYASQNYKNRGLFIDGIETTRLVPETKLIAHLPLFVHPKPQKVLIIALGMGTTFRSTLTHDISKVDVVELVPSVPKTLPLFHPDAQIILTDPRGKIIINDGRQYVHTTKETYDIVTIDPPPPVNSAGTTVLYSREFYQDIKAKLNEGGLVQQWFFFDTTTTEREMEILIKTFIDEFNYALVFRSPNNLGISIIASQSPLEYSPELFAQKLKLPTVLKDLSEWEDTPRTIEEFNSLFLGNKDILTKYITVNKIVTDDRPRTEYFLLGRLLTASPFIDNNKLTDRLIEFARN